MSADSDGSSDYARRLIEQDETIARLSARVEGLEAVSTEHDSLITTFLKAFAIGALIALAFLFLRMKAAGQIGPIPTPAGGVS